MLETKHVTVLLAVTGPLCCRWIGIRGKTALFPSELAAALTAELHNLAPCDAGDQKHLTKPKQMISPFSSQLAIRLATGVALASLQAQLNTHCAQICCNSWSACRCTVAETTTVRCAYNNTMHHACMQSQAVHCITGATSWSVSLLNLRQLLRCSMRAL